MPVASHIFGFSESGKCFVLSQAIFSCQDLPGSCLSIEVPCCNSKKTLQEVCTGNMLARDVRDLWFFPAEHCRARYDLQGAGQLFQSDPSNVPVSRKSAAGDMVSGDLAMSRL